MRRLIPITLLTATLTVCTTTQPCACPPATTSAVVYGRVTSAGSPSAGVRVQIELWDKPCGTPPPTYATNVGPREGVTGADGRYRVEARSFLSPKAACAEAAVIRGADTVKGPQVAVSVRSAPPLDSARIDIALP